MRIALAQIDPIVGDFEGNVRKILKAYERAVSEKEAARLLLTPELSLCGYPPHDLMERPEIFTRTDAALEKIKAATKGKKTAIVVGHVAKNPEPKGRRAQNCISVVQNGEIVFTQAKTLLPTYDVFDEARYFEPAHDIKTWDCDGQKIAFAICEDLWGGDTFLQKLYDVDPVQEYLKLKPSLLISISASPYEYLKRERREQLHAEIAKKLKTPLVYINQFGATDDILFDGASFVVDAEGKLTNRLATFAGDDTVIDTTQLKSTTPATPAELDVLIQGLICGIRSYFERTGFKLGILGLSGGIDSAVVAVLAVRALGEKNVLGVAMPSQVSSSHSLEDAEILAQNLKTPFFVKPIKFLFSAAQKEIANTGEPLAEIALENLQSRLRGNTLMALANHYNALVLTTGNKSEMAMGYCTLYGDMCGAIAPIGDVYKTKVYEIAKRLNELYGNPIPVRSITKAPSAELKQNQTDQDSLPPYDVLDELLTDYLEKVTPVEELKKRYNSKLKGHTVESLLKKIEINEYKRRQAAPTLKVSTKAFGVGRRVPIAKLWDQ